MDKLIAITISVMVTWILVRLLDSNGHPTSAVKMVIGDIEKVTDLVNPSEETDVIN